jgi:hypothetical protein
MNPILKQSLLNVVPCERISLPQSLPNLRIRSLECFEEFLVRSESGCKHKYRSEENDRCRKPD